MASVCMIVGMMSEALVRSKPTVLVEFSVDGAIRKVRGHDALGRVHFLARSRGLSVLGIVLNPAEVRSKSSW